jgi:hypothetical protein
MNATSSDRTAEGGGEGGIEREFDLNGRAVNVDREESTWPQRCTEGAVERGGLHRPRGWGGAGSGWEGPGNVGSGATLEREREKEALLTIKK